MRNRFNKELELLDNQLIEMSRLVGEAISNALNPLIERDRNMSQGTFQSYDLIKQKEYDIEDKCLRLLLHQHPVAGDLRLIYSILKLITDMERIGYHAQAIAELSSNIIDPNFINKLSYIPRISDHTILIVDSSIKSFLDKDLSLAQEILASEGVLDDSFNIIKNQLIDLIREDIANSHQSMDFLIITKHLISIGNYAKNIAAWLLFSIKGYH